MSVLAIVIAALVARAFADGVSLCKGFCGRVVDANSGDPIPKFTVALFAADDPRGAPRYALPPGFPQPPGPHIDSTKISSAEGFFDVDTRGAANVYAGIASRGYRVREIGPHPAGDVALLIELERIRTIRGRIVDTTGRAVAGAAVHRGDVSKPLPDLLDHVRDRRPIAVSDDAGQFEVDEPVLPSIELLVTADSFLPRRFGLRQTDEKITVTLRDGVALDGLVHSVDGVPVAAGAVVEARCDGDEPLRIFARADGRFRFAVLPRSRCRIIGSRALIERDYALVPAPPHGTASVDLEAGAASVVVEIP